MPALVDSSNTVIITGTANPELAVDVASLTGLHYEKITVGKFADGEIMLDVGANLTRKDVIIIQSTPPPVNDYLMELLLMISTVKRAGAKYVTAIIPYLGYTRQTDKHTPGSPISCSDVARLLESMGVDHVVVFDIHSVITEGFFTNTCTDLCNTDNLAVEYFARLKLDNVAVVSPDAGALKRSLRFLEIYNQRVGSNSDFVFVGKVRKEANIVESVSVYGDVMGKNIIIVDDMVDTAGTIVKVADLLKKNGANNIYAFATHGLLTGPATERITKSQFTKIVVTDTIKQPQTVLNNPKIDVVSIKNYLSEFIKTKLL